ncbi:MAG: serine hydrolase domain-containing protein [Bacteroidota bacterium]
MKLTRIVLLLLILMHGYAYCQTLEAEIDKIYKVKENAPGYSIAVFKSDQIIFEKQYGIANMDYDIPITQKTLFDVGSVAKQFTAYAILLLEERGQLSIKDPAYQYIDQLPRYLKGDPTIEQLLNQTSGISEVDGIAGIADLGMNDLLTQSRMMNFIVKARTLNFSPGAYFQYTNSNYILLADIIAKVSGKSFANFMMEDVFEPFDMKNTIKKTSTYSIIKNRAIGYVEDEGDFYKTHLHAYVYNGDGQVLTTARDMFKWHVGLKRLESKSSALYKKMHTQAKLNNGNVIDYGLGVEYETHNGYKAYGFDGMILGGFVSKYLYFPELDIAFFTTQNTFNEDFDEQFFQLVDLYITKNSSKNDPTNKERIKEVTLSKDDLKSYEGDYLFMGSDVESSKMNTIQLRGDRLSVLTADGDEITKLKPIGNHQFLFNDKIVEFDLALDSKSYKYYDSENELPWLFTAFKPYDYKTNQLKELEGQYFNADYQISKKVKLKDGKLYVFSKNGSRQDEIEPISEDVFDYSSDPIEFIRNENQEIIGLEIMKIVFEKI